MGHSWGPDQSPACNQWHHPTLAHWPERIATYLLPTRQLAYPVGPHSHVRSGRSQRKSLKYSCASWTPLCGLLGWKNPDASGSCRHLNCQRASRDWEFLSVESTHPKKSQTKLNIRMSSKNEWNFPFPIKESSNSFLFWQSTGFCCKCVHFRCRDSRVKALNHFLCYLTR